MKNQKKSYNIKDVSIILIIAFAMAIIFDSEGILKWAQQYEIGAPRNVLLSVAEPIHSVSDAYGLDEPRNTLRKAFRTITGMQREAGFINTEETFALDTLSSSTKDTLKTRQTKITKEVYTVENPIKILLIGDSMMGPGFGAMLLREMEQDSLITPTRYFKHSSGLSRPDFYNWFYQIKQIFATAEYDAVVVMMGTNDAQSFEVNKKVYKFGKKDWIDIYRNRVDAFVDTLSFHTKRIFWLGMPPMRESGFNNRMEKITQIFQDEVSENPRGCFISTVPVFGDENGEYSTYLKIDKRNQRLRANDGIHMTNAGGILLTKVVMDSIKSYFTFEKAKEDTMVTLEKNSE